MRAHLAYLKYVIRHKWFVFLECCKLGIPLLGLIHDWSKFLPSEWFPYVRYFYGNYPLFEEIKYIHVYCGHTKEVVQHELDFAWLCHQHRNKHHWQHWMLVQDEDEDKVLPMPNKYRREMLADWHGAGQAITGKQNTLEWYKRAKNKMQLHPETRAWIEEQLEHHQ